MADFLTNLWESVFTPGTTPTLLLATNATFALLQLTLAALLAFTFSIHFVILSALCGGLWWSINWFADEVQKAQEKENEERRRAQITKDTKSGESADDEAGDTETEDPKMIQPSDHDVTVQEKILDYARKQGDTTKPGQATALDLPRQPTQRASNTTERSGDISTDSEWEKVEEER